MKQIVFVFLISLVFKELSAARILALIWHQAESHFPMFSPLLKGLASRGHHVVVVSHFPRDDLIENYTDISILGSMKSFKNYVSLEMTENADSFLFPLLMFHHNVESCASVFEHENVETLLKSNYKFDLIINEVFGSDCFLGFVHKFKAPHIALVTSVPYPWTNARIANVDNPSYIPNYFAHYTDKMNFWGRLINTLQTELIKVAHYYYSELPTYEIAKKYLGEDLPALSDIARNTSLVLVNSHFSINYARPTVPAFVEVAGLHIQDVAKLPQDIQMFIDEAPEGVIYFSLGSMFRADTFPQESLQAFIRAFKELPLRVLWKCDVENMPSLPDNIRVYSWMPQRDILAHPKVRLFITHGGMMGTQEAVYFGVPMVGLPFLSDQKLNIQSYVSKGVAVKLNYKEITFEGVLTALKTVLFDPRYKENMKKLSLRFHNRPQSALDTANFWTEYVIRHQGAPHLRSAALDLTWYQYLLLDVITVITASIIIVVVTAVFMFKRLWNFFCQRKNSLSDKIKSS